MTDYARFLNPDVVKLRPSGIRKFFEIAETMEDVVSLGVGEPDFATPCTSVRPRFSRSRIAKRGIRPTAA